MKLAHLKYLRIYHSRIRNSSSKCKNMATDYHRVLAYWFGKDLTALKTEKYSGNDYVFAYIFTDCIQLINNMYLYLTDLVERETRS